MREFEKGGFAVSNSRLEGLQGDFAKVIDVHSAISLLHWDLEVYMPPKGAAAHAASKSPRCLRLRIECLRMCRWRMPCRSCLKMTY